MPREGPGGNHGAVTRSAAAAPRLYRRPDRGLLGGVATGIAQHVGLPVRTVRIVERQNQQED